MPSLLAVLVVLSVLSVLFPLLPRPPTAPFLLRGPLNPAMPAGAAAVPPEVRMPRSPSRLRLPALALIALVFLVPALATALPPDARVLSAVERPEATPGLLSQLWGFLSALWAENGSILEPDGAPKPNTADSGDNGSGLEPDGRP